jgi:hypothetical protein
MSRHGPDGLDFKDLMSLAAYLNNGMLLILGSSPHCHRSAGQAIGSDNIWGSQASKQTTNCARQNQRNNYNRELPNMLSNFQMTIMMTSDAVHDTLLNLI